MINMKAAVLKGPYDINVTDTERPEIGNDQVLIRVKRCGICGSDIHAYKGKHPDFIIPVIPGHEFSGVIEEVGSSVKRVKEGDRVVVEPLKVCGKCYYCRRGAYNKCTNLKVLGAQANGAFAEYIAVDERWVYRLPDNVSFEEGAMVEPLAVAVHAVKRANHVGDNVLVLGSGTIGLLLAQVLKIYGASEVIVTDIKDWKLNLAKEFGAITVNPLKDDLKEAIDRVTGGIGVDSSFEAVGNEETLNQALRYTRKGGNVTIIGVFEQRPRIDIMEIVNKELEIHGSLVYSWGDFPKAIELISKRKVNVKSLISKVIPIDDIKHAFDNIISNKENVIKIQIEI